MRPDCLLDYRFDDVAKNQKDNVVGCCKTESHTTSSYPSFIALKTNTKDKGKAVEYQATEEIKGINLKMKFSASILIILKSN